MMPPLPPVPPPAASSVVILLPTICSAGVKLSSQIDDTKPFEPNAFAHADSRMAGSAKLVSAATHECVTSGQGPVSDVLGFFQ